MFVKCLFDVNVDFDPTPANIAELIVKLPLKLIPIHLPDVITDGVVEMFGGDKCEVPKPDPKLTQRFFTKLKLGLNKITKKLPSLIRPVLNILVEKAIDIGKEAVAKRVPCINKF